MPIEFLKTLLPDPASSGPRTVGYTNIGCVFEGLKDGKKRKIYIYNVCDHQECYRETGVQAVSYTTGVACDDRGEDDASRHMEWQKGL